jgi:predicted transcriptional regulator of viral defense system
MVVNTKSTHLESVRKILADQRGIIFTSDLARFDIPRTYLSILEQNKEIEKVSRGIYKIPSSLEDEMFIFQSQYKSTIFSHETALYLHDLTDRSPLVYSVSMPDGYHSDSLNASGHKIFYVNRKLLDVGVAMLDSPHGSKIRVTGLERTICDVIRSRNQMDVQAVNEALRRYAARRDKDIDFLNSCAKSFRVQRIIRQYMEILL